MLAGEAVCEVNLEARAGGCPGSVALPLGFGSDDREVDELGRGLFVGEVSAGFMALRIWRWRPSMVLVVQTALRSPSGRARNGMMLVQSRRQASPIIG